MVARTARFCCLQSGAYAVPPHRRFAYPGFLRFLVLGDALCAKQRGHNPDD